MGQNRLFLATFCATALALAPGCANLVVGRPIDKKKTQEIIPGRTTKDEVSRWFGPPLHAAAGPSGDIFVYRYLQGVDRQEELIVSFSGDVVCVVKSE